MRVTVEDLLSGPQYVALMELFLDLKEQEPEEIVLLDRYSDGSGYRMGRCDSCHQETVVYEWHSARMGGVALLALCPSCNGGKELRKVDGRYYVYPAQK